jgi:hypothetical protein
MARRVIQRGVMHARDLVVVRMLLFFNQHISDEAPRPADGSVGDHLGGL